MRIYFDENFPSVFINGLKTIQDGRKDDDIEVCSIISEFGQSAPDETWIPQVALKHGVVITHDKEIHRQRAQRELYESNKIGFFFMKTPKKTGLLYWDIVRLIIHCWPEICEKAKQTKSPFAYTIDHSTKKINLLNRTIF